MSIYSKAKRLLVGAPIASKQAHTERLSVLFGLPVFSADALSSVAYACEEILLVLVLAGTAALHFVMPVNFALSALLIVIGISYYQTIHAYPTGGGTYLVSSHNLGSVAGRIAGASLLIDYVLTVSVSISSGTAAIYSAFPEAAPYKVLIAIAGILIIAGINLRGARESGIVFAVPVYGFVVMVLLVIGLSLARGATHAAVPPPVHPPTAPPILHAIGPFLVLRAFAAACAALTGTEAIADGVQAFRKPEARNASVTLVLMIGLMVTMSVGVGWSAFHFGIVPMAQPTNPGDPYYMTVMAQLGQRHFGSGGLFLALQGVTATILFLAANTAFADFPRLSSFIARDKYLPRQLMSIGDRLVFQNGIILLALLAIALIVLFNADTHSLIPLYALGVFISFTMSQGGMAAKWWREGQRNWRFAISAFGALLTFIVAGILLYTKAEEGAWMIAIAILALLFIFYKIRKYYDYLSKAFEVAPDDRIETVQTKVLLLVPRLHRGTLKAVAYAKSMAKDCRAVHVTLDPESAVSLREFWLSHGIDIPLVILESPYRSLVEPVTDYVDQAIAEDPSAMITVIVPQGVPRRWYQAILHSNLATALKLALANRSNVVITNVRYFL